MLEELIKKIKKKSIRAICSAAMLGALYGCGEEDYSNYYTPPEEKAATKEEGVKAMEDGLIDALGVCGMSKNYREFSWNCNITVAIGQNQYKEIFDLCAKIDTDDNNATDFTMGFSYLLEDYSNRITLPELDRVKTYSIQGGYIGQKDGSVIVTTPEYVRSLTKTVVIGWLCPQQ